MPELRLWGSFPSHKTPKHWIIDLQGLDYSVDAKTPSTDTIPQSQNRWTLIDLKGLECSVDAKTLSNDTDPQPPEH